jgi:hypothetical protein
MEEEVQELPNDVSQPRLPPQKKKTIRKSKDHALQQSNRSKEPNNRKTGTMVRKMAKQVNLSQPSLSL